MRFANPTKQHHKPFARLALSVIAGLVFGCSPALITPAHAQVSIKAYISAPNSQNAPTSVTPTTVETFNGQTTGVKTTNFSSAIGVYSGRYAIVGDDNYGTGTGNYFSMGAQSTSSTPVTLTFTNTVQYFGLAYNAGDTNNGFTFYDASDKLLGRYSTAKLLAALNGGTGTVSAVNGTEYNTSFFYGKPTGGAAGTAQSTTVNHGEAYAFLNFFISGGSVKKVVFDNSGNQGTGFESDNHTISTTAQSATGTMVFVGSTDTPEASSLALLSAGLPILAGGVAARKRLGRRKA